MQSDGSTARDRTLAQLQAALQRVRALPKDALEHEVLAAACVDQELQGAPDAAQTVTALRTWLASAARAVRAVIQGGASPDDLDRFTRSNLVAARLGRALVADPILRGSILGLVHARFRDSAADDIMELHRGSAAVISATVSSGDDDAAQALAIVDAAVDILGGLEKRQELCAELRRGQLHDAVARVLWWAAERLRRGDYEAMVVTMLVSDMTAVVPDSARTEAERHLRKLDADRRLVPLVQAWGRQRESGETLEALRSELDHLQPGLGRAVVRRRKQSEQQAHEALNHIPEPTFCEGDSIVYDFAPGRVTARILRDGATLAEASSDFPWLWGEARCELPWRQFWDFQRLGGLAAWVTARAAKDASKGRGR